MCARRIPWGALAACLLLSGCATTRYTESRIELVPAGLKGEAGARASVEIEGLGVRVMTLDRVPREQAAPSLAVRLVFEPRELGYSFDPGQVVLRDGEGREWRAAGDGYRLLLPGAEFDVTFAASVEPDSRMELVLGGLARGTRRLEPVTLPLARHAGRSYDRLYWLEAIGYAIMVPLAILAAPYGGM